MKILELKIVSPKNEVIRKINFNENGLSIILGNILEPKDAKKTSNSLGKSLLLKFVDYIYGANNDKSVVPEEIFDYVLKAVIKFKDKTYKIERKLNSSENIFIDGIKFELENYKKKFEIDRNLFHKQILLQPRHGLISYKQTPEKNDITNFLKLVNLEELIFDTEKIYNIQDNIKKLKETKKQISKFLNEDEKQVDENIFILGKEIEKLELEISKISEKIKKMEISEIKENLIEEYQNYNVEFKEIKEKIFENNLEIDRMKKFLNEYNEVDISSKYILNLYKKAKIDVPDLVKRELKEVEEFHKNVYDDRKIILSNKIEQLTKINENNDKIMKILGIKLNKLGSIISENEIYKENIELYEKYSQDLKEKKFKQGQFSQVENTIKQITEEDINLNNYFSKLQHEISLEENEKILTKLKDFIYDFTQTIYSYESQSASSFFKLEVRKKHQILRPFSLDIKIPYDRGEGVGQVKKIMIDILILKFNKILDFFIQDSCCYSGGIDTRQVSSVLLEINRYSSQLNKQAIVSINKYQLNLTDEILNLLEEKIVIELSEKDKLMKFNFK